MMAPLATSWVVVVEIPDDDFGVVDATLEAYGPFAGTDARERAQAFGDLQAEDPEVASVAVLPMRSPEGLRA